MSQDTHIGSFAMGTSAQWTYIPLNGPRPFIEP